MILRNNTVNTLCSRFIIFGKIFFGEERTKKLIGSKKRFGFNFERLDFKIQNSDFRQKMFELCSENTANFHLPNPCLNSGILAIVKLWAGEKYKKKMFALSPNLQTEEATRCVFPLMSSAAGAARPLRLSELKLCFTLMCCKVKKILKCILGIQKI